MLYFLLEYKEMKHLRQAVTHHFKLLIIPEQKFVLYSKKGIFSKILPTKSN